MTFRLLISTQKPIFSRKKYPKTIENPNIFYFIQKLIYIASFFFIIYKFSKNHYFWASNFHAKSKGQKIMTFGLLQNYQKPQKSEKNTRSQKTPKFSKKHEKTEKVIYIRASFFCKKTSEMVVD